MCQGVDLGWRAQMAACEEVALNGREATVVEIAAKAPPKRRPNLPIAPPESPPGEDLQFAISDLQLARR